MGEGITDQKGAEQGEDHAGGLLGFFCGAVCQGLLYAVEEGFAPQGSQ
ncbi:hypothetical protein [Streptomyces sp. OspMP-M43]